VSDTITGSGGGHTPTLLLVYDTTRGGGATVDELISGAIGVQLGAAGSRKGRLEALFTDISAALSLETDLRLAQVLALASTSQSSLNMNFVVPNNGSIRLVLDPRTRREWTLTWDFREVP
jgi:hypothetical protein